jgi:catechol 2,3-dioxygenase-like lactoylglutathione lyase family enzyme
MKQILAAIAIVVPDYDEAIAFYVGTLGFTLIEDTPLSPDKRWVRVAPPGSTECRLLLAKAANDAQRAAIGNQSGGRVFLFLHTDDFARDHKRLTAAGVKFVRDRSVEPYGIVAVFEDPFGNKWDLVQPVTRVTANPQRA